MPLTSLDATWARKWASLSADAMIAAKDELTELDRQIGDGDHGINMERGFTVLGQKVQADADPGETVGAVLKLVAATLMSTVGGAAGPLYGTAFLRASRVSDLSVLHTADLVTALQAAVEGIQVRGHAKPGEKTMVDAWDAAVSAAVAVVEDNPEATVVDVLTVAADAADAGAEATVPLVATKGRASYLGERSAGHMDPGARSSAIILRMALEAAQS